MTEEKTEEEIFPINKDGFDYKGDPNMQWPLSFNIIAKCSRSKARTSILKLPHFEVETPIFMPVGTQGTMKGLTTKQLEELNCQIILGNTYHLGMRPGPETMAQAGGLHKFMNWQRALLTDSGGFQMVSLVKLSEITEKGVKFRSPYDDEEILLTPEKSIEIQNAIGADIMMQLDDVVHVSTTGPRVEEAMYRSIRWLDRCLQANKNIKKQNIFPVIQGGLDLELRKKCMEGMVMRKTPGYAIGGLSGGEEKDQFCEVVGFCTSHLPECKPRYVMGVGYAIDLVVSSALGADMFDCVFPTRTARFGTALVPWGQIQLKTGQYSNDFQPIDKDCLCSTCKNYTRAYIHALVAAKETVGCHLVTIHNIAYQMNLMKSIRESIKRDNFPDFVEKFFDDLYPNGDYPKWAVDALDNVDIHLKR
eukprot:Seg1550.1 transcript_id=Seg1550.1/GoldUCD/mRNA.D3Y31 product="Queuine tRNA-ribosyltransferase catalytic subunit 1" protein_id=Seg1550.1/GoldUCD/D3Y31